MIKRFLPRDERNDYINWKDYYVFKIILCNNDVDKDHDRFSIPALYQIRDMAIGKNGILDTMPSKENKSNIARIFDCSVEYDKGKTTIDGEPLLYVRAYAFLDKRILVHCDAGISRSSAVVAAILKHYTGNDDMIFDSRWYNPNRWVYRKVLEAFEIDNGEVD